VKIKFLENRRRKKLALRRWHKWFAWYPVIVGYDCDLRWLEYVGRIQQRMYGEEWFEYCSLDDYEKKTKKSHRQDAESIEPDNNGVYEVSAYNPTTHQQFDAILQYNTEYGWLFTLTDQKDGCFVYDIRAKEEFDEMIAYGYDNTNSEEN